MSQFLTFEDGIEVNGTTIMSVANSMTFKFTVKNIFIEAGLPAPEDIVADENHWYSQQAWLNAFKIIAEKVGDRTLYKIGKSIPENAVFPPEIDNIEKALGAIDVAYHMNHRNRAGEALFDPTRPSDKVFLDGIGNYLCKIIPNENMAILTCENPYPCDFDRGIITTMAERFNSTATVAHDDSKPCRKQGAKSCNYIVTWKPIS